jgi:lysophospholipase L1-like esterase
VVGADTSCALLIYVTSAGATGVAGDPSQGPFDGVEDTLIGVQNDSSFSIGSIPVSSTSGKALFGFDGDGVCSTFNGLQLLGCPFGPTGYEGPGVSFTNIAANLTGGTVNFSPAIRPGQHAYFSLEEALATVPPFDLDPGPPALADIHMVALGDSYSSGEGTFNYDSHHQAQLCHRGPDAWPRRLQQRAFNIRTINHVACTSAKTGDLLAADYKSNPPQIPSTPDANIELVTLTVGGNDVGFSGIIKKCVKPWPESCAKVADSPSFKNALSALKQTLKDNIYPAIEKAYPNAYIAHVGYPRITPKPGVTTVNCNWLSEPEQQAASDIANKMNNAIAAAIADYATNHPRFHFASATDALNNHELCTADSWMVPIEGPFSGSEQGHPTAAGQEAYMQTVASALGVALVPTF